MRKYKNLTYRECVIRGRGLLEEYENIKYEICELTLRVCDIQKGGHGPERNIYSMKKFAEDIEMKANTLRKWMEEHRNVVKKINIKPKKEDYRAIRECFKHIDSQTPAKEVRRVYNHYKSYTNDDYRLLEAIKRAKQIRNFLQDYNLKSFNLDDMKLLKQLTKQILLEFDKNNI